jgi:hypothetical protein
MPYVTRRAAETAKGISAHILPYRVTPGVLTSLASGSGVEDDTEGTWGYWKDSEQAEKTTQALDDADTEIGDVETACEVAENAAHNSKPFCRIDETSVE